MGLTLLTPPAEEPCSLLELRAWAREPAAEDNAVLWLLMQQAREQIERLYGLQLVLATWRLDVPDWNVWDGTFGITPVVAVTAFSYVDVQQVETVLDPSTYELSLGSSPAELRLAFEEEWPEVLAHPQSVAITFTAGYANQRLVPASLRGAVAACVADWYDNRARVGVMPEGAKNLVRSYWDGTG